MAVETDSWTAGVTKQGISQSSHWHPSPRKNQGDSPAVLTAIPSVGHLPHAVPDELCRLLSVLYSHRNDGSVVQRHCPSLPHKALT